MRIPNATLLIVAPLFAACRPPSKPISPRDPRAHEALLLTAHDFVPGRHCRIVDPDAPLPDVATIVDTAAVPEYLRQAGIPAGTTGYALFSLRYDSTGRPVRARLIEATTPDSTADALGAAIASAVVQRAPGTPIPARLRIDFTAPPTYRMGKSEYCDPREVPVHAAQDPRMMTTPRGPSTLREVDSFRYDAEISAGGDVVAIRFDGSTDPNLESSLRSSMVRRRWQPALDDGLPVSGHATGSVRLELRVESRVVGVPSGTPP